ncbi:MAG TPA: glycoside hydrolase family 32 protein [Candidatus Limnocylindrales bacterium]|nr:glycoside hydrolase family 32 protein [Candidatus Limnocylindrales bacterium]
MPTPSEHPERPRIHLTPQANWLNDPNGLLLVGGVLHVTYQHNPDEPQWGRMHWGHAVSDDLVTWRHLPLALSPGEAGAPDAFGCWSGSIVKDGPTAALFYTGVRLDGDLRRQSVCRAISTDDDLVEWSKDPGNPLIGGPPAGIEPDLFRDPFVWRDGAGWGMLVGAGTTDGRGTVLRYASNDLLAWGYVGPVLAVDDVDPSAGGDGPMWECPQLLRFAEADVLIVSVLDRLPGIRPSHVMAFVGHLRDDGFAIDHAQRLGMGPDFYAPATAVLEDGRRLLLGWIPEDPPARDSDRAWAGSLTLPRIVSIDADGHVELALAAEVSALRGSGTRTGPHELTPDAAPTPFAMPGEPFEMAATLEPRDATEIVLELGGGDPSDPDVRVAYRPVERSLSVARRGIVRVAGRSAMTAATLPRATGPELRIRLIVDASILEIETDGRTMATIRLPSRSPAPRTATFAAVGGAARLLSLETWGLEPRSGILAPPQTVRP